MRSLLKLKWRNNEEIKKKTAVLSGGRTVSQWKQVKNGVYKAALPSGVNFRQLYVNDKMEIRARFPNRINEEDYSPYNRVVGFDEKEQTVSVLSSDMENIALTAGSEMVINHHWLPVNLTILKMPIII